MRKDRAAPWITDEERPLVRDRGQRCFFIAFQSVAGGCSLLALYIKSGCRAGPDPAAHLSEASLTWVEIQLRASISTPEISLYCTVTEQAWTEPWGGGWRQQQMHREKRGALFFFSHLGSILTQFVISSSDTALFFWSDLIRSLTEFFNPFCLKVLYVSQHTWFKWSARLKALLKHGNEPVIWIIRVGKHLKTCRQDWKTTSLETSVTFNKMCQDKVIYIKHDLSQ